MASTTTTSVQLQSLRNTGNGASNSANTRTNTITQSVTLPIPIAAPSSPRKRFEWSTPKVAAVLGLLLAIVFGTGTWVGQNYANKLGLDGLEIAKYSLCADHEELRNTRKCKEVMGHVLQTLSMSKRHIRRAIPAYEGLVPVLKDQDQRVDAFIEESRTWINTQVPSYFGLVAAMQNRDTITPTEESLSRDAELEQGSTTLINIAPSLQDDLAILKNQTHWTIFRLHDYSKSRETRAQIADETITSFQQLYTRVGGIEEAAQRAKTSRPRITELLDRIEVWNQKVPDLASARHCIEIRDNPFVDGHTTPRLPDIYAALLSDIQTYTTFVSKAYVRRATLETLAMLLRSYFLLFRSLVDTWLATFAIEFVSLALGSLTVSRLDWLLIFIIILLFKGLKLATTGGGIGTGRTYIRFLSVQRLHSMVMMFSVVFWCVLYGAEIWRAFVKEREREESVRYKYL